MLRTALLSLLVLSACEVGVTRIDARFSTPEHTMGSLLRAYDLEDVPQAEIRERMASRGRFELEDRELYEACFADFDGTATEEGYAGFVVGALPAGRERHHNTCATVLTRLVRRKLVARSAAGRSHRYRALVSRDELGRAVLASVRRDLFGGSLRGLVAALVGPRGSGGEDPAALRALLREIEKEEPRRGR